MRSIDKKLNIMKLNILTEQRYIKENFGGQITDVEGVTDSLVNNYKEGIASGNIENADRTVYNLVKKTLMGHGADDATKSAMYNTLADKLFNLSSQVEDANLRSELETKAKSWKLMGQQGEMTTDESLKRDSSKASDYRPEPSDKTVVGSDNKSALRTMSKDPYKLMKGIESQPKYNESEE